MIRKGTFFLMSMCLMGSIFQVSLPITLVYSMKIRRVFGGVRNALAKEDKTIWALSVLPIAYARSRHIVSASPAVNVRDKRLLFGSIFNLRCMPSDASWLELTTAFENEHATTKGTVKSSHSRTGLDDIVLSGGYNIFPTEKAQIVFYGISGFPTRWKVTAEEAFGTFVGTRFFSVGAGSELSYTFIRSLERMFSTVVQVRYIHFFDRSWDPILPCCSTIQPGDTVDLLLAATYRQKREIFETGYNPTFFLNQAVTTPVAGKVRSSDFVRQGGYITYSHIFDNLAHPVLLGAGFAFNRAQFLESRIYSGWLNVTVVF